jgi:hypothetical protein
MVTAEQSHTGTGLQSPLPPGRITTALDGYPIGAQAAREWRGRRGKVARRPFVLSTDAHQSGNLRPITTFGEDAVTMSKPVKTEAELIAMAVAELKVHADCPDGIVISVIPDGDGWEFRAKADEATVAKAGYPECVAMLVQIGDHLSKQYDVKG